MCAWEAVNKTLKAQTPTWTTIWFFWSHLFFPPFKIILMVHFDKANNDLIGHLYQENLTWTKIRGLWGDGKGTLCIKWEICLKNKQTRTQLIPKWIPYTIKVNMSPQVRVESNALCTYNFEIPATTKTSEQTIPEIICHIKVAST